jgi:hypothetical protein
MQSLFLDPARKGDLAQTAVCYTLALSVGFVLAVVVGAGVGALLRADDYVFVIALLTMAFFLRWAIGGAIKTINLLKSIPTVNSSSREFNAIQTMSVISFVLACVYHGRDISENYPTWALCIQIFIVQFYLYFFLFGYSARIQIARGSWIGFGFALWALILSLR